MMLSLQLIYIHILLNSCLSVLEKMEINKSDVERFIYEVNSVVVYQKLITRFGEVIIIQDSISTDYPNLVAVYRAQHPVFTIFVSGKLQLIFDNTMFVFSFYLLKFRSKCDNAQIHKMKSNINNLI